MKISPLDRYLKKWNLSTKERADQILLQSDWFWIFMEYGIQNIGIITDFISKVSMFNTQGISASYPQDVLRDIPRANLFWEQDFRDLILNCSDHSLPLEWILLGLLINLWLYQSHK